MKLKSLMLLTTGAALAAPGAIAQEMADSMTIVSWGGAYQASQINAYSDPYQAMNEGLEVIWDESSGEAVARMRAMYESGNVTWDLVDVVAADAIRLCDEGLAMEIDFDEMLAPGDDGSSATEDFGDFIVSDCFIPQIIYSTAFGYRSDVEEWEGRTPTQMCDVFDLENFPGTRSMERNPIMNMEWALICSGVAQEDVYDMLETDEGIAMAFAKLDEIKEETVWWTSGAETPQLLADGEAVFGSGWNGRLFALIEEQGQPVEMLWDYQVLDIDGWIVPADLPEDRLARVMDFLYFATDTQRLADQAQWISYGPARASSAPLVGQHADLGIDMAPHMPTDPANAENVFLFNYEWWADYRDDLDARFQAWLAQ
jgi:putative spermidine/putrescine transport system substrate-binding protein